MKHVSYVQMQIILSIEKKMLISTLHLSYKISCPFQRNRKQLQKLTRVMSTPTTSEATEPPPRGEEDADKSLSYKLKAGAFLAFTGGFGMLAGFAGALGQAKKQDPASFDKGMTGQDAKVEAATKEAVRNLDNAALERIRSERALHESGRAEYSSEIQQLCKSFLCKEKETRH